MKEAGCNSSDSSSRADCGRRSRQCWATVS